MTPSVGGRGAGALRAALGALSGSAGWKPSPSMAGSVTEEQMPMQALRTVLPGHETVRSVRSLFPESFAKCPERPDRLEEELAEGLSLVPAFCLMSSLLPTQRSLERPLQSKVARGPGGER